MLALILLLGGFQHAASNDIAPGTKYVTRKITSCPDVGYFFQEEQSPNAIDTLCLLCFCQDDGTATCWRRENRRCESKHHRGERNTRIRRSPTNLNDLFVRHAAREFFSKQSPEQCKPYEASFSNGCPPADWCIGCTVCECDANGRWACHILSFCSDKDGKNQTNKLQDLLRNKISKRHSKISTKKPTTNSWNPPEKFGRRPLNKPNRRRSSVDQMSMNNRHVIDPVKSTKVKKIKPFKKSKAKLKASKTGSNERKVAGKPLFIKKVVSTNIPVLIRASKVKPNINNTVDVAHTVMKQSMATVQKMMKSIERKTNKTSTQVEKRSTTKQENRQIFKMGQKNSKLMAIVMPFKTTNNKTNGPDEAKSKVSRNKRQVINENITDITYLNISYIDGHVTALPAEDTTTSINWTNQSTYIHNDNFTVDPLRLEINRDVCVPDNDFYEETVYSNADNSTTASGSFNDTSSSVPCTFHTRRSTFENKNRSNSADQENLFTSITNSTLNYLGDVANETDKVKFHKRKSKNDDLIFKNKMYNIQPYEKKRYHQTILRSLFGTGEINAINIKKKLRTYTILTKIKQLFKKIFRSNYKRIFDQNGLSFDNYATVQYNNTRPGLCHIDNEKIKLLDKIYELRNESENIIRSIRIIKGLLHILKINNNESQAKVKSNNSFEIINMLNSIVKDKFGEDDYIKRLTNDQRSQANYIKDNVHVFIRSIGKFAAILDEVIKIVRYNDSNHNKVINTVLKNNNKHKYSNEIIEYNKSTKQNFKKLKTLILNYHALQKKFANKIDSVIDNLETNINSKENLNVDSYSKINKTNAVESNSTKIIRNIRKLKIIAEKLDFPRRKKRDAIDDQDAIEYLLILMEYLLKKHALTNPSVNDGIDLLIEAIKSAPDIKPIKKKVLDYKIERTFVTTTPSPVKLFNSNIHPNSNAIQKAKNISSQTLTNKIRMYQSYEDDEDNDDGSIDETFHKIKSGNDTSSEQKQDDAIVVPDVDSTISGSYLSVRGSDNNSDRKDGKSNKKVINSDDNTYYKANDDEDTEDNIYTTFSPAAVVLPATSDDPATIRSNVNVGSNMFDKKTTKPGNNGKKFLVDAKANIDWIEENFNDVKQLKREGKILSTPKAFRTNKTRVINTENLSDITNEINLDDNDKLSAEEVMLKKRMDLLNSLDYVVEKDSGDDEKFANDAYFA